MGRKSTYKKKYSKQLIDGMRRDCRMSIDKCCQEWGVTRNAYYGWLDQHPDFKQAAEIGERDFMIAFHDLMVDNAEGSKKGNAGVLTLMAKNILKWSDKVEIENTGPEQISRIEIEVLQDKRSEFANLEHDNIEDAEYDD
jgi:hypothetical protein